MAYREDRDLRFLKELSSSDLNDLVSVLTVDKDGDKRWAEELTGSKQYKKYYPDHKKYWDLIAAELQCFGANSIVTLFRGGKGVLYEEVLEDVCEKSEVKFEKGHTVKEKENKLILKIIEKSLDEMSESDRREFAKSLGFFDLTTFTPNALLGAAQAAFKIGGFQSYQLTLIVVNAVSKAALGHGLTLAGNAAMMRAVSVWAGPIGWAVTSLWTLTDIAGPAYRVTIPAVIQVAYLREKLENEKKEILSEIYRDIGNNI